MLVYKKTPPQNADTPEKSRYKTGKSEKRKVMHETQAVRTGISEARRHGYKTRQ